MSIAKMKMVTQTSTYLKFGQETVFDFIYEIDKYNRTASKPIELNWTPAFIEKLIS